MINRLRIHLPLVAFLCAFAIDASGCGPRVPPDTSPEGTIAVYGERFLRAVEIAQQQVIAAVDGGLLAKDDATPAVRVFVEIGRGGQALADALTVIDQSKVTEDRASAALKVQTALNVFDVSLRNILKDVPTQQGRDRIAQILAGVQLARVLIDLYQVIAPLVPRPAAVSVPSQGVWIYG